MGVYHDAADALRREANRYRALSESADALERAGQIENRVIELQNKGADIEAHIKLNEDRLGELRNLITNGEIEAKAQVEDTAEIVRGMLREAETKSLNIIKEGQAQAAGLVAQANAECERYRAAVQRDVDRLSSEKAELESGNARLKETALALREEADRAESRLSEARKQIKAILGQG